MSRRVVESDEDRGMKVRLRHIMDVAAGGSRNKLARMCGVDVMTVSRAVADGQPGPGQKFIQALHECLDVDMHWLVTGVGEPFERAVASDEPKDAARVMLEIPDGRPGPTQPGFTSETIALPSLGYGEHYFLKLSQDNPVVRVGTLGFHPNDLLLMDTKRRRFPHPEKYHDHLCAIRRDDLPRCLAIVSYDPGDFRGDAPRLEAEELDAGAIPAQPVDQIVIQMVGKSHVKMRRRSFAGTLNHRGDFDQRKRALRGPRVIKPRDVIAIWTGLVKRSNQVNT